MECLFPLLSVGCYPPTALRRRHAQTDRDSSSSYKIDYVLVIKNFLNPEGHKNLISGSKVTAILLKGWIRPIGEASPGEGLRLQPAQQACFISASWLCHSPNVPYFEYLWYWIVVANGLCSSTDIEICSSRLPQNIATILSKTWHRSLCLCSSSLAIVSSGGCKNC